MAHISEADATSDLFARGSEAPAVRDLVRRLEKGVLCAEIGFDRAAQPFLACLLHRLFPNRPLVVVTEHLRSQETFQQDLETWLSASSGPVDDRADADALSAANRAERSLFYPSWEVLPHENGLPHVDTISDRLRTLVALAGRAPGSTAQTPIVLTTVTALSQRTFAPAALKSGTRTLRRGEALDLPQLVDWLEEQGYEAEAQVTHRGEIALRGGILDAFPLTSFWPVRLEFFGDDLESLRFFDPLTQISREEITEIILPPGGELGILKKASRHGLDGQGPNEISPGEPSDPPRFLGTLLDYLPTGTIFLLSDPERLNSTAEEYERQVPRENPFTVSWRQLAAELDRRRMPRLELLETERSSFVNLDAYRPLSDRVPEPQVAELQRREFFNQIHRWLRNQYAVHVFCNNDGERQRFEEIWAEYGFLDEPIAAKRGTRKPESGTPTPPLETRTAKLETPNPRPHVRLGSLSRGFICDEAKLVVVTDAEIFGRYKVQRPRRLKSAQAQAARSALDIDFSELEEGDLVVHVQHGIGRYLGLQTMPLGTGASDRSSLNPQPATGAGPECLVIEFAPADSTQASPRLYVPVSEAHLVGKYVGAGKARPPLNTLGGTRWAKAREQAEKAVRDVAAELLSIQAARESQPGHPFAPDTSWQREFESAFIYEETPDQVLAIQATKADMERPKPMDRLICGDVGFGKTEVAIRAAFKAVMNGKQVAVLVPTTVLAQQHFNTFRERMADYPARIELLSRFRTRRQQQRVAQDLKLGSVDVVIGTHRLLQEDIGFKDLGLVIIDEEQRFGVLHKEKFKMLRKLVDVLTLSATPIPRTLYLALSGARDMSTIQTPPQDRLPVETKVVPYDERVIRDAIQRELNRGGQVFFLHNRVMTIHVMEQKLRALVPNARIVSGHGQMHSDELEEVMARFVNGEADVLLSTTIIESGLDIPNANTIIIDRADRFGLSDLYQLRGRVGRYKHQAYAYLLLPRHGRLLSDVRRRIGAIKQYSTLGSGFKIAMRDLEIRGAGNLLGAEQSGHITAVGFELYCQLLKKSVGALKGETVKPRTEVELRLDFIETRPDDLNAKRQDEKRAYVKREGSDTAELKNTQHPTRTQVHASRLAHHAVLPRGYVPEPQHRIEVYRKLAQAIDKAGLDSLEREMRDRFGPLPPPVHLLLQIAELKQLASDQGISTLEVKEDKLMLTRQGDYIMIGGKFPRLSKKEPAARLKEIKRFLLALESRGRNALL